MHKLFSICNPWLLLAACHPSGGSPAVPDPAQTKASAQIAPATGTPPPDAGAVTVSGATGDDLANALNDRVAKDVSDGSEGAAVAQIRAEIQKTKLVANDVTCRKTICNLTLSAGTTNEYNAELGKLIGPAGSLTMLFNGCAVPKSSASAGAFTSTTYCARPPSTL